MSLAVLTDSKDQWRPNSFKIGFGGSYLSSKFLIIKVLDYKNKKEELIRSQNPFASILLAQLSTIETKNDSPAERRLAKLTLIRRLYTIGLGKKDIYNLFRFIDYLISLPEDFELECKNEIIALEEKAKVAFITSIEKLALREGRAQGKLEALKILIPMLLKKGFTENEIVTETGLTSEQLQTLKESEEAF